MKIKKSLVEQIIKEQSEKIKQIAVLQEERKNIVKQLNELYEEKDEENLEEIFGLDATAQGKEAVETFSKLKGTMPAGLQPFLQKSQELYQLIWGQNKGKSSVDEKSLKRDFSTISKPITLYRGMNYATSGQMGGQGGSGQAQKGEKYKTLQTDPKKLFPKESPEFDRILSTNYIQQQPQAQTQQPQQTQPKV